MIEADEARALLFYAEACSDWRHIRGVSASKNELDAFVSRVKTGRDFVVDVIAMLSKKNQADAHKFLELAVIAAAGDE